MKSYTFFWTNSTWKRHSEDIRFGGASAIDYIAADDRLPFSNIKPGDEVFIVTVQNGQLYVGGRLAAEGVPISRSVAIEKLGKSDLIEKALYVIAKRDCLDIFRPEFALDFNTTRQLELVTSQGIRNPQVKKGNGIEHMDFYNPTEISEASAKILRSRLEIASVPTAIVPKVVEGRAGGAIDTNHLLDSADERCLREVQNRKGQPAFRAGLINAYGATCCFTQSKLVELLEAAHIDPYSGGVNNALNNGLLLRADIHTLFDLHLIAVDGAGCITISKTLKGSEYEYLHGKKVTQPRADALPSTGAIATRYAKFVSKDAAR